MSDWKSKLGRVIQNAAKDELERRRISSEPDTKSTPTKSAFQRLTSVSEPEPKWFSGDNPTRSEVLARIYTVGQTDPARSQQLWNDFNAFSKDPSSPIYDPYTGSTNKAVQKLEELGFSFGSEGVTDKWLADNAWLKNHYRMETGNSPLAPSSKSTREQDAAYWYDKLLSAEETTKQAEAEWAALQEEVSYWTSRTDRNYSDEEILSKIDWGNYKTLTSMDAGRAEGLPVALNRGIGYSQDALKGVIWATRNGSTGDTTLDSVKAALGAGKTYRKDATVAAKLDPTSEQYNPYSVGSTIDDAALYFGVAAFDENWLAENRAVLAGNDATAKKQYDKVYSAEQTTLKAETELELLWEDIDSFLRLTTDPEMVLDGLLDNYPTLRKMDESLKSGNLLAMTRPVDYRWEDVVAEVNRRCEKENTAVQPKEYVKKLAAAVSTDGSTAVTYDSDDAIQTTRDNAINAAGATIKTTGTPSEKIAFASGYSADFTPLMHSLKETFAKVTLAKDKVQSFFNEKADSYAVEVYMPALESIRAYETLKAEHDAAAQEAAQISAALYGAESAQLTEEQQAELNVRMRNIAADSIERGRKLMEMEPAYQQALSTQKSVERKYAMASKLSGKSSDGNLPTIKDVLEFAHDVRANAGATEWQAYSDYQSLLDSGSATGAQVAELAKNRSAEYGEAIALIDQAIATMNGDHRLAAFGDYTHALQQERDRLEREVRTADYFVLREAEDFSAVVEAEKAKIEKAWSGFGLLPVRDGYTQLDQYAASPDADINLSTGSTNTLMGSMTQDERDTYLYLRATQGAEAARAYYDFLTDDTYGVVQVRSTEQAKEATAKLATDMPILANAFSVLASPAQLAGTAYSLVQGVGGNEINPYSRWYGVNNFIGTTRTTTKENISEALGAGTAGDFIANLFYDAAIASGDSLMSFFTFGGGGAVNFGSANAKTFLGKLGLKTAEGLVRAAPMGLNAAGGAAQEAKERGASDEQAMLMGAAAFVAETASEAITVGNIIDSSKLGSSAQFKKFLQNSIMDVFEESAGEAASELVSTWSDDLIMQELSNRSAMIAAYRQQGMTEAEAEAAAAKDILNNILYAGLTGALSSGMHNTLSYMNGRRKVQAAPDTSTTEDVKAERAAEGNPEEITEETVIVEDPASLVAGEVMALQESLDADEASQTIAIGSVLSPENGGQQQEDFVVAAAQHMSAELGAETAVETISDILTTAHESGMDTEPVKTALVTAALGSGKAAETLRNMAEGSIPVTAESVSELAQSAQEDTQNPVIVQHMNEVAMDSAVANRVVAAVADGALAGVHSQETALQQAKENLQHAENDLAQQVKQQEQLGQSLQNIHEMHLQNPSDPAVAGLFTQAINDVEGQRKMVKEYTQARDNAQKAVQGAQKNLDLARENAMKVAREQAQQEVMAQQEAEATLQAEAEAQAAAAQQQAFDDSVHKYKPLYPFGNNTVKSTDGQDIHMAGLLPDSHILTTDGGIFSLHDLPGSDGSDENLVHALADVMNANPDMSAGHTPAVWFDHAVEVYDPITGELQHVVGFVGKMNGEIKVLATDGVLLDESGLLPLGDYVDDYYGALKNHEALPDLAYDAQGVAVPVDAQDVTQTTEPPAEAESALNLESWQDPKYHGKVKPARKLRIDTKSFAKWFNDPTGDLTDPNTGKPKLFYRGFGSYGKHLYISHASKPDAEGNTYNFYMDAKSTAESYAGTSNITKLYDIVNWETAAKAMESIKLELRSGVTGSNGQIGYQLYDKHGFAVTGGWFAETDLEKFRDTYGGTPEAKEIFAGYISVKKPLLIEGNHSNWNNIHATVVDGKTGQPYTNTQSTDNWARWAFHHGYDSVILRNISDQASGHGGAFGTEVITSKGSMFKSIYNTGKLGKKNNNILYNKAGIFTLTGEPVSGQMKAVLDTLALGKPVSEAEIDNTPEAKWATEHMLKGESLPERKGGYTDEEMIAQVGEERYQMQLDIMDELLDRGSAVVDKNGKTTYTGKVDQNKRLDIVIGPPAAGKSSALANPLSQEFHSRILDCDDVKARLPEYENGLNANYLHNESRHIWDGMIAEAVAQGDNIVLPVVGHLVSSVGKNIERFKAAGYSVNLHYLELDGNITLGRALNRFISDGRYIPPSYIISVSDGGIADVYEQLKGDDRVDGYSYWSNDVPAGQRPLLYEASPNAIGNLDGRGTHDVGRGVEPPTGGSQGPSGPSGSGGAQTEVTPTKQYSKASTQQIQQGASSVHGKPKHSPQVIAKSLAKALKVGDYIGTRKMNKLPDDVLGYYETRAKYIAVRNTAAGDYTVNMHEIGHALATKLGMTGTRDMVANLDPVFAANYSAAELPGEAFAEFMWRYMADEQAGRDFAGDTYVDTFETALAQKGLAKEVRKAATELRAWVNANACDQIGATIHERSEGSKLGLREQFRRLLTGTIDASAAAETLNSEIRAQSGERSIPINQDVRAQSLLKNTASKRAFNILTKNLTDSKWNIVGDSLSTVLEQAGLTAKDTQLFERYMLALHSLDRDAQGKPVFDEHITRGSREAFIRDVQTNHPEVAAAEKAFQQWRIDFLTEFLVKPGYLSQEAFSRMNTMYPHYVPTQRVKGERADQRVHHGGKRYQVRRATGSTEDIWSPIESFGMMIDSIVTMVSANNAALAWEQAASQHNLGAFGRQITPDMRMQQVNTEGLQQQIDDLLTGTLDDDLLQQTLDLIGTTQQQWTTTRGSNNPNTLVVQHEDGSVGLWEIADVELYKLLASINDTSSGNAALDFIGKLTRGMAALTTGSNPVFAVRNFMRDFQNSVNYGSWASNYVTGAAKWLRAAYDVWTENGDFQAYQALGGGGWNRIEAGTKKGAAQYREALFKDYNTSNVGRTVKFAGKKLWETITAARLNEVVEQASRYAEFKYGQHDLSTEAGRQEAFLAAQDVTTDFNRTGNGNLAKVLKQTVPFFNASAQGVYRTARLASEAERDRLPQRFAKTVVNTALMSALASGILLKFMDDDEREEFAQMSDELKAQHIYLPNFAPGVLGEQPLIRIPLAQDPLTYAIHGMVTNAIWSGKSDDVVVGFEAIAETILDNLNPLGSGTIFQPLIGIGQNKNWYGSRIVPTRLQELDATVQYTADTPDLFIHAGRLFRMSPLNVQYLAEQYAGFLGQMLIPALSKDEITGELGGWRAAIKAAQKRFTSDPLISNDVVSSFYDGAEMLTQVTEAAKQGKPQNTLRRGLTAEDATAAYEEAKALTSASGIVGQTRTMISSLYDQIDAVNANATLTDEQKYALTSDLRRQMIEQTLVAQEAIGAYKEKYMTGDNLLMRNFTEGVYAHIPDAYESMPQTFKDDADAEYMQQAKAVWEATGEANVLPHPKTTFSDNKVEYTVQPEYMSGYNDAYKLSYQKYFSKNSLGWDAISDEERVEILKGAHEQAHRDAKKWYLKQPGVTNQN